MSVKVTTYEDDHSAELTTAPDRWDWRPDGDPFGVSAEWRKEDGWRVFLNHQCNSWDIAPFDASALDAVKFVPAHQAVADLDRFIAELTAIRDAITEREEKNK